MKKIVIFILVSLLLVSFLFAEETQKASNSATLVLNLDKEKFLVGFSSSSESITAFVDNKINVVEEISDGLDKITLSFASSDVYLYYKVVEPSTTSYELKLSIENPLRYKNGDTYSTTDIISYKLTVTPVAAKWDGDNTASSEVSSAGTVNSNGTFDVKTVNLGSIRDSSDKYLVTGFASLSLSGEKSTSNLPIGTYESTIKVSIVTE